ncbi:DUF4349 domain-containing protein [Solitalea lacus]|uniref:DUF4349 domain-containing protein n=1 Tax=Solitalea lacus TaxID=2911172 RepID=UPI001EDA2B2F|nr:DUF4349 domain-containing protein [Solitalea lacus]UKJ08714.1 DUF4349 domain-containing protein [Solitalea lacus]
MKKFQQLILSTVLTCLIAGCGQGHKEESLAVSADSTSTVSPTATESLNSTKRQFIRSSELKFKVKDVAKATYRIEEITTQNGGFVTLSNLSSDVDYSTVTKVSADSSVEIKHFTVSNHLIIRVPNTKMDTTLREIAKLVDFLDYRIIKADDVNLQLLSNNLTQQRINKSENRLTNAIDNKGQKLGETTSAEETLLNRQYEADNAKLSNLSFKDQINYSTINISVYQPLLVSKVLIANTDNIDQYKPSFSYRIKESFISGFELLADLTVFIMKLWGVILLGLIAYLLYRKYGYRLKKEKVNG